MSKVNKWLLLSPEGADSGGEGEQQDGDYRENFRPGDGEGDQGGGEGDEGKTGGDDSKGGEGGDTPPKPSGLTADDITEILARVLPDRTGGEQQQQQPPRQYTQAEIEQMLNVWKPDTGFLRKMGFQEPTAEQLAALHELRDSLVKQANTMSEARIQQLLAERDAEMQELRTYVSEQRAEQTQRAFYDKYPELKPYEEIVEAVSDKLKASGFKAPTMNKVFEETSTQVREVLKRMNVKVEEKKPATGGNGRPASRMAQLAGGGQGGGEKGGSKREGKLKDMAIFDESE